ncbi:MAG: hypothetical protein ACJ74U_10850 [Jatrophihabitantaceae bacterium]
MLQFGRQVKGELRKLLHPLVALAVVAVAIGISLLQVAHDGNPYPGPSLADGLGCIRIASLQHATSLGFLLAAVVAAVGTASEAGSGALADLLLREPRRGRVVLMKLTSSIVCLLGSLAISTIALWVTSVIVRANGTFLSPVGRSTARSTVIDVACSLLVVVLAAALSFVVALLTRSILATIVVVAVIFYLPLTLLQDSIFWVTPTRWVVEWLHLDPFGEGVDYIADNSPFDHRGMPSAVGGLLIALALIGLLAWSKPLLGRVVLRPTEHKL